MKTIATHEAKTHLSRYLKEVSEGETIIITRGRKPLAKLVAFSNPNVARRPRVGEVMDKPVKIPDDAFAPMGASELDEWGL